MKKIRKPLQILKNCPVCRSKRLKSSNLGIRCDRCGYVNNLIKKIN
ncbi:MAG: hypothetical protein AABY22_01585 [Nanoarchaeota archaeon]